ncbi:MAG: 2-oxoacid:ferredoxin oxidoreductase subunit beta [Chitinophagales bacterium]|nr:2-oxoacid:ferredoxin oxidoreductase subunit beta [Chitinophagales bacterium]
MAVENVKAFKKEDFSSDQMVRWCPGCGDYAILRAMQVALAQLDRDPEDYVFVSGIGCSSRFPYYMNTYGFHSIHGRAPALALGVKLANPDLRVWIITGDGDGLSIGGNHFIHAMRRNLDVNVILFNNEIYGLTKGQYSPTSKLGIVTKSSPQGSIEVPFSPAELALGAKCNYFARVADNNPKYMASIFVEAEKFRGTSLIEILQNCPIFNDKIHEPIVGRDHKDDTMIILEHGKPMVFGKERKKGIRLNGLKLEVVTIGENGITEEDLLVHDAHETDPTLHTMLARMTVPEFPVAIGVIRQVKGSTFNDRVDDQIAQSKAISSFKTMDDVLRGGVTWEVA